MSPTSTLTRLATTSDTAAVAALFDAYRQFYAQAPDLAAATAFIGARLQRHESVILVAEASGRMVGFCQLYPTFCSVIAQPVFTLYDLFVAADARQSGVGRALLLAAEHHAASQGFARMDLTTARTNTTAQSLYESLGWVRDEVFFTYNRAVAA